MSAGVLTVQRWWRATFITIPHLRHINAVMPAEQYSRWMSSHCQSKRCRSGLRFKRGVGRAPHLVMKFVDKVVMLTLYRSLPEKVQIFYSNHLMALILVSLLLELFCSQASTLQAQLWPEAVKNPRGAQWWPDFAIRAKLRIFATNKIITGLMIPEGPFRGPANMGLQTCQQQTLWSIPWLITIASER